MNLKIAYRGVVILALAGLFACKKEAEPTRTELLTGPTWIGTGLTISPGLPVGGGVVVTDLFNQVYQSTDRDDIFKFNADGTYQNEEGATKTRPTDPDIIERGTWVFANDENVVALTSGGSRTEWQLQELTSSSLRVTYTIRANGVNYTLSYSLRPR
jgi:hypothetical protein